MKLSDKREQDLYNSIALPIDSLRLKSQKGVSSKEMDLELFNLNQEIWKRVHTVLNLQSIK